MEISSQPPPQPQFPSLSISRLLSSRDVSCVLAMCDPTKDPRRKEYVDPRFLAPGDSSFFLESVFTSTNVYASLTLTWTASTDIFTIDRGGESKLEIPTRCISEIMHCAEKRMILVVSKTDVPSGNIILVVAEPVQNVFKLRSLFERRVGAMKVGLRDW